MLYTLNCLNDSDIKAIRWFVDLEQNKNREDKNNQSLHFVLANGGSP